LIALELYGRRFHIKALHSVNPPRFLPITASIFTLQSAIDMDFNEGGGLCFGSGKYLNEEEAKGKVRRRGYQRAETYIDVDMDAVQGLPSLGWKPFGPSVSGATH